MSHRAVGAPIEAAEAIKREGPAILLNPLYSEVRRKQKREEFYVVDDDV